MAAVFANQLAQSGNKATRMGWLQGGIYAAVGAAVALILSGNI